MRSSKGALSFINDNWRIQAEDLYTFEDGSLRPNLSSNKSNSKKNAELNRENNSSNNSFSSQSDKFDDESKVRIL